MITLTKERLRLFNKYIDRCMPKPEFQCLIFQDNYLYATDTKSIIRQKVDKKHEDFSIHKSVIETALKVKGAVCFDLQNTGIVCKDKDENEIVSIYKEHDFYSYPDLEKVYNKKYKHEDKFADIAQIIGILSLKKILIDEKYLPYKTKDLTEGVLYTNNFETDSFGGIYPSPVKISYTIDIDTIEVMIMPIINKYLIDEE